MEKISVRKGETFQLPIEVDDSSADTATLKVWNDASEIVSETVSLDVSGAGTIDLGIINDPVGLYSYSVTVVYSDGVIDILPDVSGCSDCEFPEFEICPGGYEA